jgi:metal-dependent hydrolase (beta-lactamase superfamily II)
MEWRRAAFDRELNSGAAERAAPRVADLGSTRRLEIVPLVNWHAVSPDLKTEPGVAYLVRTDHATVLFDLGYNARGDATPPLLHNMARLGVSMSEVDAVFISHRHRDHVGGAAAERTGAITFGDQRPDLAGKALLSPAAVSYPGARTMVIHSPRKLFEGMATTGPIARSLFMGPVDEQALVVNVAGRGLVVIVGCGHQTVPRLLERLAGTFSEPLYGVVGDFHYPVPEGRLRIAGLDAQRLFASGDGLFKPITMSDAQAELMLLDGLGLIALGGHDTSDEVIAWAAARFGERFRRVAVGQAIVIQGE